MNLNWSLKELYPSFESEEFKIDMDKLTSKINEVNEWANETIKDNNDILVKLEEYIKRYSKLTELISKIGAFIQLSISVNTKDTEALRYSDIFEKKLTHIVEASTKIERYISNIDNIECIIEKSELLKAHEYILKSIVEQSKYLLSDKEESIIANMKNTGSNAWSKLKDNLISSLMVEIKENDDHAIKDYVEGITNPVYQNNNDETSNNSVNNPSAEQSRENSNGTVNNHSTNSTNEDFSYNPPKSSEKLGSVKAADRPLESTPSNQSYYEYDKSMGYNFETSTPQSSNNDTSQVNVGASKIESKTSSADIKLVDKNKKPVSDIKVSLEKDKKVVGEAMSDQTGTIVLNALQKGNYKLKVLEVGQTFKAGQVFDVTLKEDNEKKEFTIENNMVKITNEKKQKTYYEVYDGYTDKLLKKLESNDKGELVLNSLKYGAYYFVMGNNKSNTITVDKKFANATVNFDKNMKAKAVPVVQEDNTVEKGFIEGDKDQDKKLEQEIANQEVKSENKSKSPIKLVLGALGVALLGGIGFFVYKKKKGNNQNDIMDDFDL
ncbi:MAG: hypothetical protein E7B88_03280 [Finegoldia magna]|nr:hypothetical protein [Finegoldia magna]